MIANWQRSPSAAAHSSKPPAGSSAHRKAIRRRARTLDLAPLVPERHAHATRSWRADEDELLRRAPVADLVLLSRRLGRSDQAIGRRLATPGLRVGRERSPHRALTQQTTLSVGERRLVLSALESGGGKLLALSRRLGQPPGELRRNALTENPHEPLGSGTPARPKTGTER
jgi:hypothetical protein